MVTMPMIFLSFMLRLYASATLSLMRSFISTASFPIALMRNVDNLIISRSNRGSINAESGIGVFFSVATSSLE